MASNTFQYDPTGHSRQLYHSRHRLMNWVHAAHIVGAIRASRSESHHWILDAGCSDGELLVRLAGSYAFAVGLDHNFQALPTLQQRLDGAHAAQAMQGDLGCLPFRDRSFDRVFCLETLEHVPDMPGAVRELQRVLKEEGTLIITIPLELGFSVLLKQSVARLFFGAYRGSYTWREIWNAFRGRLDQVERVSLSSHKGFDFRKVVEEIRLYFDAVRLSGLPFRWLGTVLNTQVLIEARRHPKTG